MRNSPYENFYISIDGRILKKADEDQCYEHEYIEDFDSETQFLEWAKCLTGELDKYENIGNGEFEVFEEYSGLPMYSYGESHYWNSNQWSHLDKPKDIIDVLHHFRTLFPNNEVKLIKETITVSTKKSTALLDW